MMRKFLKYFFGFIFRIIIYIRKLFVKFEKLPVLQESKILIISCSGIGNAVLSLPLLDSLRRVNRNGKIDILVASKASKTIFEGIGSADNVYVYKKSILEKIKQIRELGKSKYDFCFFAFPTLDFPIELLPFFINVHYNISHDYQSLHPYFKFIKNLYYELVPIIEDLHDVEQNFGLLEKFSLEKEKFYHYPEFRISEKSISFAQNMFRQNNLSENDFTCIIHPGSKKGTDYKRWPLQNFIGLAHLLYEEFDAKVVFILGPDEQDEQKVLNKTENEFVVLQSEDLEDIIAVISLCKIMISNDSGIMHTASLTGIPIYAVWGGTDEKRNGARGSHVVNIINENIDCRPCVRFIPERTCKDKNFACIREIRIERVFEIISSIIKR